MSASSGRRFLVRASAVPALAALLVTSDAAAPRLAKVAAVQNVVESRHAGGQTWTKSTVDEPLGALDRVRTGPASRASILYADDTLHRLDEKSEVEIVAPEAGSPGLLRVLTGRHYFASR